MGKNKRKSKHKSGKSKPRQSVIKENHQGDPEDEDVLIADEITALSAIFQEDFNLISDHHVKEFSINLRAHSDYDGDFAAQLLVKCFPGYPWKPPKLQMIVQNEALKSEAEHLQSMLMEQASATSREGRVMIFNLAEVALEYLAERITSLQLKEKTSFGRSSGTFLSREDEDDDLEGCNVFCDIWGGQDGTWELSDSALHTLQPEKEAVRPQGAAVKRSLNEHKVVAKAETIAPRAAESESESESESEDEDEEEEEEESEEAVSRADSHATSAADFLQKVRSGLFRVGRAMKHSVGAGDPAVSPSPSQDHVLQKDMIMGHLLRLACGKRGPLPEALPALSSQLAKIGVIPAWLEDLVARQPHLFESAFKRVFTLEKNEISEFKAQENVSSFWNASPDLIGDGESSSGSSNSRYLSDFEELCLLGRGGFGHVVLCKNKLDGRRYAMKKIRLQDENPAVNEKIKREVATLSRLQHQHVVRYYQAWFETGNMAATLPDESSSDWVDTANSNTTDHGTPKDDAGPTTLLYIQMEYCPKTLLGVIDDTTSFLLDKDTTWAVFRQIVEGLVHIHGQGIIHRDLTPSNIFFDARNDIKIGDFGLAKFSHLENPESDVVPGLTEPKQNDSIDGTGQVGTYFYRAPEVEQAWVHIDDKVDMYSLGVILFELWHPFSTKMERYVILNQLKQQTLLPPEWEKKFPPQASLVRLLLSPEPKDRPSAQEVLRSELLPPRMEDEALKDILRTIQTGEKSSVYDQVIGAIFDEERFVSSVSSQSVDEPHHHSSDWMKAQERVIDICKEVFGRHGAQKFESVRMKAVDHPERERNTVKFVTSSGSVLGLRSETKRQFARWAALQQCASLKRYEISEVYRKGVGSGAPDEYLQGDFDIVGGARVLAEAETIKVALDIISKSRVVSHEVRLNHHVIANAIFKWSGVPKHQRANVAQMLQCRNRQFQLNLIRSQLHHGLPAAVVDKLQMADRRFTGNADDVLARLKGALPQSHSIANAIEELSRLLSYLRVWRVQGLTMDVFMPRAETYYDGIYFQIHLPKGIQPGIFSQGMLLAAGGRCDSLLDEEYRTTTSPGVVGLTVGLQKLVYIVKAQSDMKEPTTEVLICCRGGGGLLKERMEVADELWAANVKASFVCATAPSMTEQYEYAHENGIKWLVIITESGLSQSGSVKVRHLDFKSEVDVQREDLSKYFTELGTSLTPKKRTFKYS